MYPQEETMPTCDIDLMIVVQGSLEGRTTKTCPIATEIDHMQISEHSQTSIPLVPSLSLPSQGTTVTSSPSKYLFLSKILRAFWQVATHIELIYLSP